MVNKKYIRKTFNEIINKHSDFLYNIEDTLHQITDSKEEYKTLHDDIWRFWMETKKSDHEQLIIKGTDGTFLENREGGDTRVSLTDKMENYMKDHNVFYSIHNHPNGFSCFQSANDFKCISIEGAKYSISCGDDGLMIVKNSGNQRNVIFGAELNSAYEHTHEDIEDDFTKEYSKEIEDLKKKYDYDNPQIDIDAMNEYYDEFNGFYKEWFTTDKVDEYCDNLNEEFQRPIYGHLKEVSVYHVQRKRDKI